MLEVSQVVLAWQSRSSALLLDGLIVGCVLALIWLGPLLLTTWLGAPRPSYGGWLLALIVLLSFAVTWGYFVYFEGLRSGQTPGKRWLGIRVVHDGGFPLTVRGAAVRNLVRFVDIQPIPSCLVGGLVMMLHPRTQRLGDLAAIANAHRVLTAGPQHLREASTAHSSDIRCSAEAAPARGCSRLR